MNRCKSRIHGPVAVIGDVHGQLDKLDAILAKLRAMPDYENRHLVFIGDLVDRGPNPAGVVQRVVQLLDEHPKTTAVLGNHELAMLGALQWVPVLESTNWPERWVESYDSESTFASYGVAHGDLDALAAAIPRDHWELLTTMPWCVEHPQNIFVHAGLDPNQPTDLQLKILEQRDWSLSRPTWLCSKQLIDSDGPSDNTRRIVSGHVPVPEVVIRSKRILVDTTGGVSGDLSCVLLPEAKVLTSASPAKSVQIGNSAGRKPESGSVTTAASARRDSSSAGSTAKDGLRPAGPRPSAAPQPVEASSAPQDRSSGGGSSGSSRSSSRRSSKSSSEPAKPMTWWKRLLG